MQRENPDVPSLETLQSKIDAAKKSREPKASPPSPLGQATHIAIDLVTGTAVGAILGYGLDVWFGTLPVFMLLGFCVGVGAGVKLMMRTLKELEKQFEQQSDASQD